MVTGNLKDYTDENIVELIENIEKGEIICNLNDLKQIMAEINNRSMDTKYSDILGDIIKKLVVGEGRKNKEVIKENLRNKEIEAIVPEETSEIEKKYERKSKDKTKKKEKYNDDDEEIKYPVLEFLAPFLKVLGWVGLVISIFAGIIISLMNFSTDIRLALESMFVALLIGTFIILTLYGVAENIELKMDIEKHLDNLDNK